MLGSLRIKFDNSLLTHTPLFREFAGLLLANKACVATLHEGNSLFDSTQPQSAVVCATAFYRLMTIIIIATRNQLHPITLGSGG